MVVAPPAMMCRGGAPTGSNPPRVSKIMLAPKLRAGVPAQTINDKVGRVNLM